MRLATNVSPQRVVQVLFTSPDFVGDPDLTMKGLYKSKALFVTSLKNVVKQIKKIKFKTMSVLKQMVPKEEHPGARNETLSERRNKLLERRIESL